MQDATPAEAASRNVEALREELALAERRLMVILQADSEKIDRLAQQIWLFVVEQFEEDSAELVTEARASEEATAVLWHRLTLEREREKYRSLAEKFLKEADKL